jgi:Nucleotide-diphospho-sugar transferase
MTPPETRSRGVIFAATGPGYVKMARNAAESVRRHCPGLPIHFFTDTDAPARCFDHVTRLEHPWRRSKIDAMIAAPFERTLFLDADVFVVADLSEIFDVLDRFDIALAHDQERNSRHARTIWRKSFSPSFPQFNSGVIAYRRTEPVIGLMRAWRDAVRDNDMPRDQAALRELLWSSDLRIATLPPEYNMMDMSSVLRLSKASLAPRVIHHYALVNSRGRPPANSVEELLGTGFGRGIEFMRQRDHYLSGPSAERRGGFGNTLTKRLLQLRMLADLAARRLLSFMGKLR